MLKKLSINFSDKYVLKRLHFRVKMARIEERLWKKLFTAQNHKYKFVIIFFVSFRLNLSKSIALIRYTYNTILWHLFIKVKRIESFPFIWVYQLRIKTQNHQWFMLYIAIAPDLFEFSYYICSYSISVFIYFIQIYIYVGMYIIIMCLLIQTQRRL